MYVSIHSMEDWKWKQQKNKKRRKKKNEKRNWISIKLQQQEYLRRWKDSMVIYIVV